MIFKKILIKDSLGEAVETLARERFLAEGMTGRHEDRSWNRWNLSHSVSIATLEWVFILETLIHCNIQKAASLLHCLVATGGPSVLGCQAVGKDRVTRPQLQAVLGLESMPRLRGCPFGGFTPKANRKCNYLLSIYYVPVSVLENLGGQWAEQRKYLCSKVVTYH